MIHGSRRYSDLRRYTTHSATLYGHSFGGSILIPTRSSGRGGRRRKRRRKSEGDHNLSESSEEFKVFNQPPSSEDIAADLDSQQRGDTITFDEMGIQRKNQRSLLDLIKSQPGRDASGKFMQPKLPPPLPKSPFPFPQPPVPPRPDPADPKRNREQKGNEIVETGRSRPTQEDETQRVAKQQKTTQTSQRRVENGG